jgi:hypothetical protein
MSTVPAAGVTLLNAPPGTAGGKENVGTATSNTFTMTTPPEIKCIDTYSVPPNDPTKPPGPPYNPSPNDGLEKGSVPVISLTNISLPTPWTVPATGKSESLSGLGAAPNNTGAGTFDIFPDVKITISSAVDVGNLGVGSLGGTLYVSIHLISGGVVIVKVLLVAVPTFSLPPAVPGGALSKVTPAAGTVDIT